MKRIAEENPTELMLELKNSISQIKTSMGSLSHNLSHAANRIWQEDEVDKLDQSAKVSVLQVTLKACWFKLMLKDFQRAGYALYYNKGNLHCDHIKIPDS